jgi:UDP-2,3-diacylglucosamine hydrolase
MAATYFVADAHLGFGSRDEELTKEKSLVQFLHRVADTAESLYILGDLFNFWFEYASVIPRKHIRILLALRELTDRGVDVHYLAGNHDFWLGDFFPHDLGVRVYTEPIDVTIDGKRFWISHGDGLMKKDRGYRLLKRVLRNPLSVRLYGLLHPDLAFGTAAFFAKLSRKHPAFPDRDSDYIEAAEEKFNQGFDCVVLAHTHSPLFREKDGHTYVNTGDWMRYFTYAVFEKGKMTLERWPGVRR